MAQMPKAGRPAKTPGKVQPKRTPGALNHLPSMRDRAKADEPWNATGKAALPLPAPGPQPRPLPQHPRRDGGSYHARLAGRLLAAPGGPRQ